VNSCEGTEGVEQGTVPQLKNEAGRQAIAADMVANCSSKQGVLGVGCQYRSDARGQLKLFLRRALQSHHQARMIALNAEAKIDTDRQLPEMTASVDDADGRFVIDTGNSNEVLLFKGFIDKHPGLVSFAGHGFVSNRGVGGSTAAVGTTVSDLHIGPYHLYNRYANVMLSTVGAFADRNDGGNVGYGVLKNFVTTFDLANGVIYLDKARGFDDGRFRPIGG